MKVNSNIEPIERPAQQSGKAVQPKISVGYRVGSLTVEKATEEKKCGYWIWLCRCDCGGSILLDTRCLKRGTVRDCGCVTKVNPGQRDLSGQRFGKLVCVAPTERRENNGSVLWECRCDCGNICLASSRNLLHGYKRSCGCLSHSPFKDYIGRRFGQLTVISYAGKREGIHWWWCRCDCGNEVLVSQMRLLSEKMKSCGCDGTSVTILEARERKLSVSNVSGYTGVLQRKDTGKWVAQISFKGKQYHLGTYEKMEGAIQARKCAEEELNGNFLKEHYALRNAGKLRNDLRNNSPQMPDTTGEEL